MSSPEHKETPWRGGRSRGEEAKKDRINILGSVWEQKSKKRVVVVRCCVEGGKVHALTHASETSVRRRTNAWLFVGVREKLSPVRSSDESNDNTSSSTAAHRLTTALPGNCTGSM